MAFAYCCCNFCVIAVVLMILDIIVYVDHNKDLITCGNGLYNIIKLVL